MKSYFSLTVLALFLPATMLCYQLMPRRLRWLVLLAASYIFFWSISGKLLVFLLISTGTIWLAGIGLDRLLRERASRLRAPGANRRDIKRRYARYMRFVLAAGLVVNLSMLFAFKYLGFAQRLLAPLATPLLAHAGITFPQEAISLAAPIGISFYTLQAVSYLIDVHRQSISADRNPARLALFLSFFPLIMEGPICRYGDTAQALWAGRPITAENISRGGMRILWGLAKKVIVADRVNLLVKTVFEQYGSYDGGVIALAAVLYTVQLYCDFSGTMDFVMGCGRIFGVTLPENFKQPYLSRTASEFWQRWHITLGTWFRDYVFYPLSLSKPVKRLTSAARKAFGNRMGPLAASGVALLAVWLGNGLWHGAGGQYVLFGSFWFVAIWIGGLTEPFAQALCERLRIDRASMPYRVLQHVRTLAIIFVGELIFRAQGGSAALGMLGKLFGGFTLESFANGTVLGLGMDAADFVCVGIAVAVIVAVGILRERGVSLTTWLWNHNAVTWSAAVCALAIIVVIFGAYGAGYVPVDPMYASF